MNERKKISIIGIKGDKYLLLVNCKKRVYKDTYFTRTKEYEKFIFIDHDLAFAKLMTLKELMERPELIENP